MNVQTPHIGKANAPLREALHDAKPDANLRAILFLGPDEPVGQTARAPEVRPSQFGSRTDYRAHLIAKQAENLRHRYGETLQKLRDLDLDVRGGEKVVRAVVVEGTAKQILSSLGLPNVRAAKLDQPIELIRPRAASE
jgi:hypothetical protein